MHSLFTIAGLNFPPIQFQTIEENGLRTRLDFTIENGKYGLYDQHKNIVDIETCLQITPELQAALTDIRKIHFPIRKGSVRLRVGPDGKRGVWLDFANIDIKNLLSEKKSLQLLLDSGFQVEIGQKGKSLSFVDGEFKLVSPVAHSWFKARLINNNYVSLKSLISSFTQPSWKSAEMMTDFVLRWVVSPLLQHQRLIEFGPGIGQFTLPLLSAGHVVDAFEFHDQAAGFLLENAKTNNLDQKLKVFVGDYHKLKIPLTEIHSIALVNPPRSGLKEFVFEIIRLQVEKCIYISCYPESLTEDLKILEDHGWQLQEVQIVDQFPQTKHFETCVLLKRINA